MSFDIKNMRRGDQLMGGGAVALFIAMFFFKWYGGSATSSVGGFNVSNSLNGWHSFTNSRWVWLITIIVALGVVAIRMGMIKVESPVSLGAVVAALGALSTVLIFYRIVHHPSGGISGTVAGVHYSASYGIKIGIWIGLIAAGVITYGGIAAMQEEGTSLADTGTQAGGGLGGSSSGADAGPAAGSSPTAGSSASAGAPAPAGEGATPPLPPPAAPPAAG
jgi:hypothetical protein